MTEVCKAVLAESFGVKVISHLLCIFRFNVGLDVRLLLPLSSSVFPFYCVAAVCGGCGWLIMCEIRHC